MNIPTLLYLIIDDGKDAIWTADGWSGAGQAELWVGESRAEAEKECERIFNPGNKLRIVEMPKEMLAEHCDFREARQG